MTSVSLCSLYESRRKAELEKNTARRRWRAKLLFEQCAGREDQWRAKGELAIKDEMERRVIAWLLVKGTA